MKKTLNRTLRPGMFGKYLIQVREVNQGSSRDKNNVKLPASESHLDHFNKFLKKKDRRGPQSTNVVSNKNPKWLCLYAIPKFPKHLLTLVDLNSLGIA